MKSVKYFDIQRNLFIENLISTDFVTGSVSYKVIDGYTVEESIAIYEEIRDYLCDMGHIGDNFQATSTNDPTFWVMHTNMERVWHLLRIRP